MRPVQSGPGGSRECDLTTAGAYREDAGSREVWQRLADNPDALLVDVRSRAEWTFVGMPDLSPIGRQPVLIEWQSYPGMQPNPGFVSDLGRALEALGADQNTEMFFLCRSGGRSAAAAAAMTAAGYANCVNVADGFEGRLDPARHRGGVEGWKAAGLPWIQS
jgi:rhodanese-related sulfurtransferase